MDTQLLIAPIGPWHYINTVHIDSRTDGMYTHSDEPARKVKGRRDLEAFLHDPLRRIGVTIGALQTSECANLIMCGTYEQHVALDLEVVEHEVAAEEPEPLELDALDVLAQVELQVLGDVAAQRRRQDVQHGRRHGGGSGSGSEASALTLLFALLLFELAFDCQIAVWISANRRSHRGISANRFVIFPSWI